MNFLLPGALPKLKIISPRNAIMKDLLTPKKKPNYKKGGFGGSARIDSLSSSLYTYVMGNKKPQLIGVAIFLVVASIVSGLTILNFPSQIVAPIPENLFIKSSPPKK